MTGSFQFSAHYCSNITRTKDYYVHKDDAVKPPQYYGDRPTKLAKCRLTQTKHSLNPYMKQHSPNHLAGPIHWFCHYNNVRMKKFFTPRRTISLLSLAPGMLLITIFMAAMKSPSTPAKSY